MKCVVCKGSDIELKTVDEQIRAEKDIILVPMTILVCSNYGERYYHRKSMRKKFTNFPLPRGEGKVCKFLYRYISSVWKGTLLLGEKSKHLVVGGIFLKFKNRFSDEFRAWNRGYNELRPNYYLYWEAIKLAHNEGYKIFDFGRQSKFQQS